MSFTNLGDTPIEEIVTSWFSEPRDGRRSINLTDRTDAEIIEGVREATKPRRGSKGETLSLTGSKKFNEPKHAMPE